jgi:hypothetical protein
MEADALSKIALQVPEGRIHYSKWQDGHEAPTTFFSYLSLMVLVNGHVPFLYTSAPILYF